MKLGRLVFIAVLSVAAVATALQAADVQVVAGGLNNPRGITIGPEGAIYVTEAGKGGSGPCVGGAEGAACFGLSGSITRIDLQKGTQTRVVTGLPSLAAPDGSGAIGPHDIGFQGRGNGFFTIGLGNNPNVRPSLGPDAANLAHTARMLPNGTWIPEANLGNYEASNNPDGGHIDDDPYGILVLPSKQIVAEAGGNDLLEIGANGVIRTLAVFANRSVLAPPFLGLPPGAQIPMEAVPTTVIEGPNGNYYVGQLTGFPFPPGGANVYSVPKAGGTPAVAFSGFTNIIDIALGPDGALYVLEISKNGLLSGNPAGALIRVASDGTRTEVAPGHLTTPGGIVFGDDGAIYVTNNATSPGGGQVLRITQ
jgi:hypothetical protein